MSGHSKWSTIKRKKGAIDAKRGKIFTKIIKEITLAARLGGGDIDGNARLRQAVMAAKEENMPKDNIERAIKKGIGGGEGAAAYEEVTYEGYGPGGAAVIVDVMTDNKNRTVAEIRHIFSKHGGNLGENGCVSWIFAKKGSIVIDKKAIGEDELMELVLEAGAEDVRTEGSEYEVITEPAAFEAVKKAIDEKKIKHLSASIGKIPSNTVKLDAGKAESMLKMMEKLEDNDDVQNVYSNFDIDEDVMEKLS
ncbi:MAG TPA: YebC/PmpR family DNA-binding transcriptional regulator [Smithellaceae bacterium]|jgi:YebC/PmpR family DNA-binding regulatory protein|nr:YebC/PmpR family DNA-binding transcriptional regulator [Smithella sp.]HNZ09877.1 YebC/PmpR family DNA-binding transcriptional regulator [Smithellaceae bacterium]HOG80854.1 YebC/PmpR family DNA-binding transcriptional regulator [Smithellaceae bacterium]HOQ42756.1 YebC/PmpR family DNA-binding transcriptional regulator [Smithellaceae bacterium]HPL65251.1 YebC/PmpR family DNA-binding transcriptional regulator [Smithellaceae bacterium]